MAGPSPPPSRTREAGRAGAGSRGSNSPSAAGATPDESLSSAPSERGRNGDAADGGKVVGLAPPGALLRSHPPPLFTKLVDAPPPGLGGEPLRRFPLNACVMPPRARQVRGETSIEEPPLLPIVAPRACRPPGGSGYAGDRGEVGRKRKPEATRNVVAVQGIPDTATMSNSPPLRRIGATHGFLASF